jgi:hypothetical protein
VHAIQRALERLEPQNDGAPIHYSIELLTDERDPTDDDMESKQCIDDNMREDGHDGARLGQWLEKVLSEGG